MYTLLFSVLAGIALLLLLILFVRMHAFIALLVASIVSGLLAGLDGAQIVETMQNGMGSTLGFVATVVGLGAMFGAMLEVSGGAQAIAQALVSQSRIRRAPWAMMLTGFIVSIPVFFDVALIILIPVIYGLQRKSGKSLLMFGMPLLAGLAVTHAFVPPTPGPVAVAQIIGAQLGMVILIGILAGLPAAIAGGVIWGRYIASKIHVSAPESQDDIQHVAPLPSLGLLLSLIVIPLLLILSSTLVQVFTRDDSPLRIIFDLIGHPFTALIIANLLAWYLLGIRRGVARDKLMQISARSLAPAGTIILLTGAGGVFKQVLVDTGSGEMIASILTSAGISILLFAFLAATLVRLLQGSATVAMITSAGLTAPLLTPAGLDPMQLACIVIAIASGATFGSHVNDSGFWLVSQYMGLTEKQTIRSWTVMTMIVGFTGLALAGLIYSVAG